MASKAKTVGPNQSSKRHVRVQTDQKLARTSNSEHWPQISKHDDSPDFKGFATESVMSGMYCHGTRIGPVPRQPDSPAVARLSDYRNSAPSRRKPDSPQQPINCTNTCRGTSHPLLRFCALGSGVNFVAQQQLGKMKFWS
jgi:hypothetical protein